MISDLSVYQCAKLLVDNYGDQATLHAGRRAIELHDKGDWQGAVLWLKIRDAVIELLRERPGAEEVVH